MLSFAARTAARNKRAAGWVEDSTAYSELETPGRVHAFNTQQTGKAGREGAYVRGEPLGWPAWSKPYERRRNNRTKDPSHEDGLPGLWSADRYRT